MHRGAVSTRTHPCKIAWATGYAPKPSRAVFLQAPAEVLPAGKLFFAGKLAAIYVGPYQPYQPMHLAWRFQAGQ